MAIKIPWMLLTVLGIPVIMVWTKALRMDAREKHEIQMRVKYHSEFWEKGNNFVNQLRAREVEEVRRTADPLLGREVDTITAQEWKAAEATNEKLNHKVFARSSRFLIF